MNRPEGQPGEFHSLGETFPAVATPDERVSIWLGEIHGWGKTGRNPENPLKGFEPASDWTADCPHEHRGYAWCDTEDECDSLKREDERLYGR